MHTRCHGNVMHMYPFYNLYLELGIVELIFHSLYVAMNSTLNIIENDTKYRHANEGISIGWDVDIYYLKHL